jgi:cytochrome c553
MNASFALCFVNIVAVTALSSPSHASEPVLSAAIERGATTAHACQGCHSANGEGMAAKGYPRLAGQAAVYLAKQLDDFASGRRTSPVMTSLAKTLTEQQRRDVGAYFASLATPYETAVGPADSALLGRGRLLARSGDESKQLQACANCHGPGGSGERFAAPYLEGQSATYLATTIKEWKSGARANDAGKQMVVVANRLDDRDITAVAAYFAGIVRASPTEPGVRTAKAHETPATTAKRIR